MILDSILVINEHHNSEYVHLMANNLNLIKIIGACNMRPTTCDLGYSAHESRTLGKAPLF